MILIWVIMAISCLIPLTLVFAWHRKTLQKYWQPIIFTNFLVMVLWGFGDAMARHFGLWHISFDSLSATEVFGTQLGSFVWFMTITFILSVVTIIMWEANQKKIRFRDAFFKKTDGQAAFIISRIFGPLPLLCLLWFVTAVKSGIGFWRALWVYPLIFLIGIAAPFGITTLILLLRGKDFDWKHLEDRYIFIPIFGLFWSIDLFLIYKLTSPTIFHLSLLAATMTTLTFAIMRIFKFKVSLHIMTASGIFWGINFMTHFNYWWISFLLIPIIWARFMLRVHTMVEILGGLILANGLILLAIFLFGYPAVP